MKVILVREVEKFGKEGAVVNVADGYARNYLIPKGFAIEATKKNLRAYETRKRAWNLKHEKDLSEAKRFAEHLDQVTCKIARKVGEKEKLFGSVTSMDILEALKREKIEIDKKKILLDEPIKSIGNYSVPIRVHPEITAFLKIEVVKDESE